MHRQNHVPFMPAAFPRGAAPVFQPPLPARVPQDFIEAMKLIQGKPGNNPNIRTPEMIARTLPFLRRPGPPVCKWKSSFKPVDGEDNSEDKGTSSSEGVELYDPYNPILSGSDFEMPPSIDSNHCLSDQDKNLGQRRLSPSKGCLKKSRWDCSQPRGLLLSPETRSSEKPGLSPGCRLPDRLACSPGTESVDRPGHSSIGRPLDQRVCSPDRNIHGSSIQQFPASYGGQRTNMEEPIAAPDYRRDASAIKQMTTAVKLLPPRSQRDQQPQLGHMEAGEDHIQLSTEMTRNSNKTIIMDKSPITCDLCDVELPSGQELEDHLDSKSHWDTLEHIQQQNSYDDLAIAFLQEVMMYKSRQCSRAIEDSALQALQENDHMTKVEMFHCAACDVFVSTSASSVQTHITSQNHLSKTKEFELQQRLACLDKAETILKELKPQFEHFIKGGSPFE
ncbi:hypothetical protein Q5P01_022234 [Channa striata]|uniref:DBIRD complex subunit ZNF326 n=1 Tax=Channa striata TaxID=64152 RepID=A0AA88IWU3_CHASR|nr:hypothetical protein Q5P01_022234 [Channa striata]